MTQLKNEIKAAQKRIEDQKKILERAEEMGVTEKVLPEQTENNIRAARESLKIFREELRSRLKPTEAAERASEPAQLMNNSKLYIPTPAKFQHLTALLSVIS